MYKCIIYKYFFFRFDMDDKKLNVVQYFRLHRNYTIKYPHLPCLHVGNVNKKYAIPIEVITSLIL